MKLFHNPWEKWAILICVSVLLLLGLTEARSEHRMPDTFFQTTAPILCGNYEGMSAWLKHNEFEIISVGFGRAGGVAEGEPVYMVQGYLKKDTDIFVASIETPARIDKCLMYNLYDYREVDDKGVLKQR